MAVSLRRTREHITMTITVRAATAADSQLLAEMNSQLTRDEGSRNPMDVPQLATRMEKWLSTEWQAVLFEHEHSTIGYSVFQIAADYYDPSIPEVHLRHFFIVPERRRRGLGRKALQLLIESAFPSAAHIYLDVLATNPRGKQFWESMGFQPYSLAMRLTR
jgi:GNAT superfamily N-acetyltransferase